MALDKYRTAARTALRDLAEIKRTTLGLRKTQQKLRDDLRALRDEVALRPELVAVNSAAFERYRDAFRERDVVIAAPGPTLAHYEPIAGAIHVGVNGVVADTRIPLDVAFVQDFVHKDGSSLQGPALFADARAGCQFFFGVVAHPRRYQLIEASHSLTAAVGATRYFVDASPSTSVHYDIRFNPLADWFSVVLPALHFALFTNPRRIYLAGVDTTYFGHHDDTPQPGTGAQIRPHLTQRLVGWRTMRDFARRVFPDTEIVSLNPVSLAGLFTDEYTPGLDYRRSPAQPALATAGFTDEAIATFVDAHIAEIQR